MKTEATGRVIGSRGPYMRCQEQTKVSYKIAPYSLYSALISTRPYRALVKSSALYREWSAIWDSCVVLPVVQQLVCSVADVPS